MLVNETRFNSVQLCVKCECTQGWNGMGWRVVSLSPRKIFNETKLISKNENKQKNYAESIPC